MKINKYTELSGLMPREEWTKLMEINASLLKACKDIAVWNQTNKDLELCHIRSIAQEAINKTEGK